MNTIPNVHGEPIWYELMTKDLAKAQAFYSGLIGWHVVDAQMPDMDYHLAKQPHETYGVSAIGGIMPLSEDMTSAGAMSCWLTYFGVDDVDAAVERAVASGAEVQLPAFEVPDVGRMAMLSHPHTGPFYVMKGSSPEPSTAFAARAPMQGHVAWNELSSSDPDAAKAFLADVLGLTKNGDMDMGPLGKYEFLSVADGAFHIGAVMPLVANAPDAVGEISFWKPYFRIPDIDAAVAFIAANGGTVLHEPVVIPDGEFSVTAMDADSAVFGCIGPRV